MFSKPQPSKLKREGEATPSCVRGRYGQTRVNSKSQHKKVDHTLLRAVYFLLSHKVTIIEIVVTMIEIIVKISLIDLPPFGIQPNRVRPLSTAPCTVLYYTLICQNNQAIFNKTRDPTLLSIWEGRIFMTGYKTK